MSLIKFARIAYKQPKKQIQLNLTETFIFVFLILLILLTSFKSKKWKMYQIFAKLPVKIEGIWNFVFLDEEKVHSL